MFNNKKIFIFYFVGAFVSVTVAEDVVQLECKTLFTRPDRCQVEDAIEDYSNHEVDLINPTVLEIKAIEIEDVHLGRVPKSLKKFENLIEVELDGCHIFSLDSINRLPHLEKISLERNNISEIKESELSHPKLEKLELNDNEITNVAETALLTAPKLKHLDLSRNKISTLPKNVFRIDLQTIELQENDIEDIEDLFNHHLALLRLNLFGNKIKKITNSTFAGSTNIFKLILSNNQIEEIDPHAFDTLKYLQTLYLNGNRLKKFKFDVVGEYFTTLELKQNQLIEFNVTTERDELRKLGVGLAHNQLESFNISMKIPVKMIDASFNDLKRFNVNLTVLDLLYLDNNNLGDLAFETILSAKQLKYISLNDTNIGPEQFKEIVSLPNLKTIDVSYNPRMAEINFSEFEGPFSSIEGLQLNFCNISAFHVAQMEQLFPSLKTVGLLGNNIKYKEVKKIVNFFRKNELGF